MLRRKKVSIDFFTAVKSTCYEILPKNSTTLVATEISILLRFHLLEKKRIN
jgi:hypothetical protein